MTNSTIRVIQNNIKKYRNKRGLTQDKISEMAGIYCDYFSEIEKKKKIPSLKRFIAIADALDIPYEKFFK